MSPALLIFDSSWLTEAAVFGWVILLAITNTPADDLLHMQVPGKQDLAAHLGRLIDEAVPGRRGLEAWGALLEAHATLMRQLQTDLVNQTGLDLNDFDVISQLAQAGGRLRMTDLAARAFSSRSGLTRRIDRLVEEGLVGRTTADGDARGVVVTLTEAGVARVLETVPVHLRTVAELFMGKLDDNELAALESALKKVILDRRFG
jgi:DNA-binding MarR family transcriptional regulator